MRKAEKRGGGPPRIELPVVVETHSGFPPLQSVQQLELLQIAEKRLIRSAYEVVVALDLQAVELERRRHPANARVALENRDPMSRPQKFVRASKAHRPRTDYADGFHTRGID